MMAIIRPPKTGPTSDFLAFLIVTAPLWVSIAYYITNL